jgi:DNA gyrase subunit B
VTKNDEETQYIEIFQSEDLAKLQQKLEKHEMDFANFEQQGAVGEILLAKDKKNKEKKEEAKPLCIVEEEARKQELFSLREVLAFVRAQAKKGMHIQRYKGLGEMNPQQLWETTMDPERRTILKVTLEDAVEVDKTFSMLMGDEVEPRRAFIETYAHEVKDLDI